MSLQRHSNFPSHLPTFRDPDVHCRSVAFALVRPDILHFPHHIHALVVGHLTEDNVFAVKERRRGAGDEKLASIGVGAGVSHGEQTGPRVAVEEVFVGKIARRMLWENARGTGAVAVDEISTLYHEGFDLIIPRGGCVRFRCRQAKDMVLL